MSALVSSRNANLPQVTYSSSAAAGVAAALSTDDVKKFRAYFKAFTSRFVQSVVQSRMGINISHECRAVTDQSEWFNLYVDELGEISAEVRRNLKEQIPEVTAINLDILLKTADGEELQLEAWRLSLDLIDVQPEKVDVKTHFYHNLSTALKSVITAARCTPAYRRYVFSQNENSYILCYRLYTGENIAVLGDDAVSLSLVSLPSPFGRFMVDLRYRTKMEIERRPSTPPPVQTGRTRAFSERLPSDPNLTSFDRHDQRRHSAREGPLRPAMPHNVSHPGFLATSPEENPEAFAESPNFSEVVGPFSTSPASEYSDALSEPSDSNIATSKSRSRRSSRKSSDGEEGDKEKKKEQIQKFPFSGLLDRVPTKPRMSQSMAAPESLQRSDKHSSSCLGMTIEEEEEEPSGSLTPQASKKPEMTEEQVLALPTLLQSFLAPQFFDFSGGDDSIPNSEDSYVRVPLFGSSVSGCEDQTAGNEGIAATVDLFQYRADKELSAIFEVEDRSAVDFQALIKGYAAEKDKFDEFVESVCINDEDSD